MRVSVKVQPRSSKEAVVENPDGTLKVYLRQAPCGGEANRSMIKILAGHYGVRKTDISIITGETNRKKIVEIRR